MNEAHIIDAMQEYQGGTLSILAPTPGLFLLMEGQEVVASCEDRQALVRYAKLFLQRDVPLSPEAR